MKRSTHTAMVTDRGHRRLRHSAARAGVLGLSAAALAALAACSGYSINEGKVRLSAGDRVAVSPENLDRYSCEPASLVCESVSGGGRLTKRECQCMNPAFQAKWGTPASPLGALSGIR